MGKYKLTKKAKVVFGRTLLQIEATVSFGAVKKGDKGGWVEKEDNLSQEGNAWVSGNAEVSGNARVSPITVTGLAWPVTITDTHMRIGCEYHSIDDWRKFKDSRIILMDSQALEFWSAHKTALLALCDFHESVAADKQEAV